MVRWGILALSLVTLAGCGSTQSTSTPPTSGAGIVNGSDVTTPDTYSQHVVFIQMQMGEPDASGRVAVGDCTGSILNSETILTAGHCVSGATKGFVVFADNAQDSSSVSKSQVRIVDSITIYPKYQPDPSEEEQGQGTRAFKLKQVPVPTDGPTVQQVEQEEDKQNDVDYDVALIHFQGGLPAGYTPVTLATSADVLTAGTQLHFIGYGLSEVNALEVQTLTGQVAVTPQPVQSTVGQLRETVAPLTAYDSKVGMLFTDSTKTGVCSGDSGGPAFTQDSTGKIVQVGIAEAVANAYCNSVSMHTAVLPYLSWIKQATAQLDADADQQQSSQQQAPDDDQEQAQAAPAPRRAPLQQAPQAQSQGPQYYFLFVR